MLNTTPSSPAQSEINDTKEPAEIIEFLLDSGAQCHLVNCADFLLNVHPVENFKLHCANSKAPLFASYYGTLRLRTDTNVLLEFKNVFYVKDLPCNLLSVGRIIRNYQFGIDFHKPFADIYEVKTHQIIFSGHECEDLMYVKLSTNLEIGDFRGDKNTGWRISHFPQKTARRNETSFLRFFWGK